MAHPSDDSTPAPRPGSPPPVHHPSPLEYYAANAPQRERVAGLNLWAIVLFLAWVPYLCGIVNASTVVTSYSPEIIASHTSGAMLFMGAGLALSITSLVGFIRQHYLGGMLAAGLVILVQCMVATCLGLALS
jgi:hypothetical protein